MELAKRQSGKGGMLLVHTFERSRSQCDVHGHQISVVVDTAIVPVETPIPKAKIVRATAANTSGVATVIDD
jgi:hypothetical protein